MAPAKKQVKGVTPSPVKARKPGKKPPKEVRSAIYRAKQAKAREEVRSELKPDVVARSAERKPTYGSDEFPYTQELGAQLFGYIIRGMSLDAISQVVGCPSIGTMLQWIGKPTHPFSALYAQGKSLLVPLFEERAQDAALKPEIQEIRTVRSGVDAKGNSIDSEEIKYVDNVERAKLKLLAYQWTLSHLVPKKHGRNPADNPNAPNSQLEALFASLKSGPKHDSD